MKALATLDKRYLLSGPKRLKTVFHLLGLFHPGVAVIEINLKISSVKERKRKTEKTNLVRRFVFLDTYILLIILVLVMLLVYKINKNIKKGNS